MRWTPFDDRLHVVLEYLLLALKLLEPMERTCLRHELENLGEDIPYVVQGGAH